MKLVALVGNQLRHKYFVDYLSKKHDILAVFTEDRFDQKAYGEISDIIVGHFSMRDQHELKYFSGADWPKGADVISVARNGINSKNVVDMIRLLKPEGITVLGCGLIAEDIIDICPKIVNAHQGLSPYYRGSGTNFWPFYNEEPEYVGVTVHYIDRGVDTGKIICHGRPEIIDGEGPHDIGCKTIIVSVKLMSKVFTILEKKDIQGIPQWGGGREYVRRDFTGEAIKKVHSLFENGFIKRYLDAVNDGSRSIQLIDLI